MRFRIEEGLVIAVNRSGQVAGVSARHVSPMSLTTLLHLEVQYPQLQHQRLPRELNRDSYLRFLLNIFFFGSLASGVHFQ